MNFSGVLKAMPFAIAMALACGSVASQETEGKTTVVPVPPGAISPEVGPVTPEVTDAKARVNEGDTKTLVDAKAHRDQGDAKTLVDAKATVSKHETEREFDVYTRSYADALALLGPYDNESKTKSESEEKALVDTKAHASVGDAKTFFNAKAHASEGDTKTLVDAKAYASEGDTKTLVAAKAHASEGDARALAEAKAYANKIKEAEDRIKYPNGFLTYGGMTMEDIDSASFDQLSAVGKKDVYGEFIGLGPRKDITITRKVLVDVLKDAIRYKSSSESTIGYIVSKAIIDHDIPYFPAEYWGLKMDDIDSASFDQLETAYFGALDEYGIKLSPEEKQAFTNPQSREGVIAYMKKSMRQAFRLKDSFTARAFKAHANEGDAKTLVNAKAYADEGDAKTLGNAKAYADQGDTKTLTSANAYTDNKVKTLSLDIGHLRTEMDDRFKDVGRRIDRQGAMSAAMMQMASNNAYAKPGQGRLSVGLGHQGGQAAGAIGYGRRINENVSFSLGAAFSGSDKTVGVGFGVDL